MSLANPRCRPMALVTQSSIYPTASPAPRRGGASRAAAFTVRPFAAPPQAHPGRTSGAARDVRCAARRDANRWPARPSPAVLPRLKHVARVGVGLDWGLDAPSEWNLHRPYPYPRFAGAHRGLTGSSPASSASASAWSRRTKGLRQGQVAALHRRAVSRKTLGNPRLRAHRAGSSPKVARAFGWRSSAHDLVGGPRLGRAPGRALRRPVRALPRRALRVTVPSALHSRDLTSCPRPSAWKHAPGPPPCSTTCRCDFSPSRRARPAGQRPPRPGARARRLPPRAVLPAPLRPAHRLPWPATRAAAATTAASTCRCQSARDAVAFAHGQAISPESASLGCRGWRSRRWSL